MSKGHPYRYEPGFPDRHRGRFGQQDGRRDIGSPYRRQRRSSTSGNDFTTFSYEDCHQEVGLGNFNDFSAISRDTILERDKRRDVKPPSSQAMSALSIQTSHSTTSTSNVTLLSVSVSPSSHTQSSHVQKSGSLLSSFQQSDRQPSHSPHGSQPVSPYKTGAISTPQHSSKVESSPSSGHNATRSSHATSQPVGLLMQVPSADLNLPRSSTIPSIKEEVYQPKVEAVSPTNSETESEKANVGASKEEENERRTNELLKQMEKVDKEISEVEKKISDLKEKQKTLEDEISQDALKVEEEEQRNKENENENVKLENGIEEETEVEVVPVEPKEKSLIERIYEENRKKAADAHEQFANIGIPLPSALPLYNQPSDLPFYEENRAKARAVQLKLVKYFQRKRRDKQIKQRALLEQYRVLHKKWMEKVEKIENNQKRKNKEARIRDFYEKIFPEIKRHREQTERFSRIGSRTNWGMSVRSDAEYEEILRDLEEKERHEKHMRQLAVDPPPLLDEDQRRVKYINRNGLIKDLKVYVEQKKMLNIWTEKEKETFKEKYIEAPKDFEYIAKFIPNKTVKDCVLYYYRTKRTGNFKKLAKKQSLKRKRLPNSTGKDEGAKSKILKPRPEGYRSESDIDDEEPFDEDSDGSEGSSLRIPMSTGTNPPVKITTPQAGNKAEAAAASVETPRWSKNEREIAIEGLRLHGRNWPAISQMVKTKTEAQCKNFYFNYKRKLDLEHIIAEHNASKIQRQESEETISASEASDDAYDILEERPSVARSKQKSRETRSQAAERRSEPMTGPTLRNSRGQRITRNRSADGKPRAQTQEDSKLHEVEENTVTADKAKLSTAGSAGADESRIIIVDTLEPGDKEDQREVVRDIVGSRGHVSPLGSYVIVPVSSSTISVAGSESMHLAGHSTGLQTVTSSQPVTKLTTTSSDRQHTQAISHGPRLSNVNLPCATESPKITATSSIMYPNVPYRPLTMETAVAGTHSEALLNLARSRAAAESAVHVDSHVSGEDPESNSEKEKLKMIRVPDPQLPTFEQNQAIGIFNRYSPCIPPDTTSRPQVRTQRVPHPFHPAGIAVPQFIPHIGAHGTHFPPEMFAMAIPHGPVLDPIYHPQLVEYFHPGMEHNLFSTRLREEAARANPGAVIWPPPLDPQGIIFAPHPPFIIPTHMEPVTPTECIPRRRESSGHELISPVSSTRCRSVETAAMYPRPRTPEQLAVPKPMNQQRSVSLTDVHSWVASGGGERRSSPSKLQGKSLPSPKDSGSDQVKLYEPFTALMNAAVGARPIVSSAEGSRSAHEQRVRESLKISEAERPQAFTRQSCVVTNTSVLHVTSAPKDASGKQAVERHGISSGLAPPQPPPLLTITGGHAPPPKSEAVVEFGRLREAHDSCRGVHPRESTPTFSQSPKEQHPPPLLRDTPPLGMRRVGSTATRDVSLPGRAVSSHGVLPCGCASTEQPCKHQLYSHEVPYVRSWQDGERKKSAGIERDVERTSKSIFRPWTEDGGKESRSSSPLKTASPTIPGRSGETIPQKRRSVSPRADSRTPPAVLMTHLYPQQSSVLITHPTIQQLITHPTIQQTGMLISPPTQQRSSPISRPIPPESRSRSPHPLADPQFTVSHPSPQERNPRSVLSQAVAQESGPRSLLTTPRPSDSSSQMHPRLGTRSGSPLLQQSNLILASSQPSDQVSRNIRERSPHPPPLMPAVYSGSLQPAQPDTPHHLPAAARPLPSFPPEQVSGTSHGVPYPHQPPPSSHARPSSQESSHALRSSSADLTSQHLSSHGRSDILYSEGRLAFIHDSPRFPLPSFDPSRTVSELTRTSMEKSQLAPPTILQPSRAPTEPSRALPDSSRATDAPSISPGRGHVRSPPLVDNRTDEAAKPSFIDQAEVHQSRFDAAVDIQRHVNPSYIPKLGNNHSPLPEDVDGVRESSTVAAGKITTTLSPRGDYPPNACNTSGSVSDLSSPRASHKPSRSEVDPYPDDETTESREDNRSIAESSSVGFESPDDEDHELRMRYFPESDDNGEDAAFENLDTPSDQRLESDDLGSDYSEVKGIGGGETTQDEEHVSERRKNADDFFDTEGTCIPSDSTYIDFSERSDEPTRTEHGYDSSAGQDIVDSTVSDLSEPEQTSAAEKTDREQGGRSTRNGSKSQSLIQDESVSGIEADDDASDDESLAEEMEDGGDKEVVVDVGSDVKDSLGNEADSSIELGTVPCGIALDTTGDNRIVMGTRSEVDRTEADGEYLVENQEDTLEENAGFDEVSDYTGGMMMKEGNGTQEGTGEILEPRSMREDEEHLIIREVGSREEELSSSTIDVPGTVPSETDEGAAGLRDTVDRMDEPTNDTGRLTGGEVSAKATGELNTSDVGESSVRTDEEDAITLDTDRTTEAVTMFIGQRSRISKEVTSSSDPRPREGLQGISEVDQSKIDGQPVNIRDEISGDVNEFASVDSSTDRGESRDATEMTSSRFLEDNCNLSGHTEVASEPVEKDDSGADNSGTVDAGSLHDEHVTSSEEHVTSSKELVHSKTEDGQVTRGVNRWSSDARGEQDSSDSGCHVITGQDKVTRNVSRNNSDVSREIENTSVPDQDVDEGEQGKQIDTNGTLMEVEHDVSEETMRTLVDICSTSMDNKSAGTVDSRLGSSTGENDDTEMSFETNQENENVRDVDEDCRAGEVGRNEETKARSHEVLESGMETNQREITKDNRGSIVTSAEDSVGNEDLDNEDMRDESGTSDDSNAMIASTSRDEACTRSDVLAEQAIYENLVNNDITSTVEEMRVASPHADTHISSTFDTSTVQYRPSRPGEIEPGYEIGPPSGTPSSGVSTSSNIAKQRDDVATSTERRSVSDVSSSDVSENAENANELESRRVSSQDLPDSADLHDISRRSSEDSTSNSDKPSTTNLTEPKTRHSDSVTEDHESNDFDLSENEAESMNMCEEGEREVERDLQGRSVNERDNLVDSSTVSPVSFTEDVSHTWSTSGMADTSVDTTGYLGMNRTILGQQCTTVDTTGFSGINEDNRLSTTEDSVGTTVVTPSLSSGVKYDITVEAISSDEEELEEGEIAETPGEHDDVTSNDVTPEHMITSSGSYYPPLDTIPISPPADDDDGLSSSSSAFLDFGSFIYSSMQSAIHSDLTGSSRVPHSVFPYSALNVRSAPNSHCSSPVSVGFASGCNTPIRFQQADSSNILTGQYEPLSDDEESHDTEETHQDFQETERS